MASDPLTLGPHRLKPLLSIISSEQFAEETRQVLDSFLRQHLADIRNDFSTTHAGSSYLSGGSVVSDGIDKDIFMLGAPVGALRRRTVSPQPHIQAVSGLPTGEYVQAGQACLSESTKLYRAKRGEVVPAPVSSSSSSETGVDTEEVGHNRSSDAQSSGTSGKNDRDRPRLKKSTFKRVKERLRRSILRSSPDAISKKKHFELRRRKSSSPMIGRRVGDIPTPTVQRSTSAGGSKQPTPDGGYQAKRRSLLERLRCLGRSVKQDAFSPVNTETSRQRPKKLRRRDIPSKFRQFSDSISNLRDRIGGSPRSRRRSNAEHRQNHPTERCDPDGQLRTSTMTISVQRPSTSSASHNNSEPLPLSPSTAFAKLSLVANASRSSSQRSTLQSRQCSIDSEIYSQIAARLGQLGDEYVTGAIEAARLQQEEVIGCTLNGSNLTELERDVVTWVQSTSGLHHDCPDGLDELTQASTANEFGIAIDRAVRRRSGAPATQLALVFHFTSVAMRTVGATTLAARRLGDYCVSYVGNKFADWLMEQGGWMSVVEDATTSCSEID
uniref:Uncharacterized protein n=1 Tax=Plectus sambesii TaxID=2011161 RepID=A0A914XC17_9BILA